MCLNFLFEAYVGGKKGSNVCLEKKQVFRNYIAKAKDSTTVGLTRGIHDVLSCFVSSAKSPSSYSLVFLTRGIHDEFSCLFGLKDDLVT